MILTEDAFLSNVDAKKVFSTMMPTSLNEPPPAPFNGFTSVNTGPGKAGPSSSAGRLGPVDNSLNLDPLTLEMTAAPRRKQRYHQPAKVVTGGRRVDESLPLQLLLHFLLQGHLNILHRLDIILLILSKAVQFRIKIHLYRIKIFKLFGHRNRKFNTHLDQGPQLPIEPPTEPPTEPHLPPPTETTSSTAPVVVIIVLRKIDFDGDVEMPDVPDDFAKDADGDFVMEDVEEEAED
ncbi:MAG: hypothetical protein MMC33_010541 [Icmadophila ericetorum]|nr:hypothetical protein [Icmadophila ericetorum]